jgi:uncharacterized protein YdiU (UPF0061 family)
MATLESLAFDNGFARLPESFYSRVCPTPVPDPYLVCTSPEALTLLDLDEGEMKRPELIETLALLRSLSPVRRRTRSRRPPAHSWRPCTPGRCLCVG